MNMYVYVWCVCVWCGMWGNMVMCVYVYVCVYLVCVFVCMWYGYVSVCVCMRIYVCVSCVYVCVVFYFHAGSACSYRIKRLMCLPAPPPPYILPRPCCLLNMELADWLG